MSSLRRDERVLHPSSEVDFFSEIHRVGRHHVVYVNCRPERKGAIHYRHREVQALLQRMDSGKFPAAEQLVQQLGFDPTELFVREELERGLTLGLFQDSRLMAQGLGTANRRANFQRHGLRPLRLLIVHAELEISEVCRRIIKEKVYPAGIIIGGSPKMVADAIRRGDEAVERTMWLIRTALDRCIPIFGICFGFQLMMYVRFGALPQWVTVPDNTFGEFHSRVGKFSDGTPGMRKMSFGSHTIRTLVKNHVLLTHVDNIAALKIHSQGFPCEEPADEVERALALELRECPEERRQRVRAEILLDQQWRRKLYRPVDRAIPKSAVLAVDERMWRPGPDVSDVRKLLRQPFVEVVECGEVAAASQGHCELVREHPRSMLLDEAFCDFIASQGHKPAILSEEFKRHPEGHSAGSRLLYNNQLKVVAREYVERWAGKRARPILLHALDHYRTDKK